MKRLPIVSPKPEEGSPVWFQTAAELTGDPSVEEKRAREFEDRPYEPPPGVDRRTFMALMGASMALGGLATGCRRPKEKIYPYTRRPEDMVDGKSTYYATSVALYGTAIGLLVESTDGRPTKIEGNPAHPSSRGGTTGFVQATVLDLYDPDRSKAPRKGGKEVKHEEAWTFLGELGRQLSARKGRGLAILVGEHRSPTVAAALEAIANDMPDAELCRYEAFGRENARSAAAAAFGEPLDVSHDLEQADTVVVLDGDILGTEGSPVRDSKGYARRREVESGSMSRVYVAEACPSVTGMGADHRLRIQARRVLDLAKALAAALGRAGAAVDAPLASGGGKLSDKEQKWVDAAAQDLARSGKRGVVVAGRRQPPAVHAVAIALNHALGAVDTTVRYVPIVDNIPEGAAALAALVDKMEKGTIDTLLVLGENPVFTAPADVPFSAALAKVKTSVHVSTHFDETSQASTWHIPRAHYLESWGDTMSDDGTLAVVQPLIAPLYGGKTDAEILERLVGGMRTGFDMVSSTWGRILGPDDFDRRFRRVLHDGFHIPERKKKEAPAAAAASAPTAAPESAPAEQVPEAAAEAPKEPPKPPKPAYDAARVSSFVAAYAPEPPQALEVVFAPDPHAYDGRFANNGWMMELPDPIHKGTWGTYAALSQTTAQKLGVKDGDHVEVAVGPRKTTVPAIVTYGHADDSITLPFGLGRKFEGRVCQGVGVATGGLRTVKAMDVVNGTIIKVGGFTKPAITQGHFVMEGRPLVRTQTTDEYKEQPAWAKKLVKHPPLLNLYEDWKYDGHKWGMTIDLSKCHGCTACIVACQAENNIPVLDVSAVLRSREMHWIRIDRYFGGRHGQVEGLDEAEAVPMPLPCQHCENAPCEQVCPVAATTHSPEGINEMTYNRCIGTKYCGNNCPYKVRRFNFFAYDKDLTDVEKLQLNPDVTVRSRGVMEKCTFCVQRVNQAKIAAKNAKAPEDKARIMRSLTTACAQACPTDAIRFGDLNDPGERPDGHAPVAHLASLPRAYGILEEINTRPRVKYLARITNRNAALPPPLQAGDLPPDKPKAEAPKKEAH
jgi:molybdopterin-containing oxidoreductase family iron-sulfur binding subunit